MSGIGNVKLNQMELFPQATVECSCALWSSGIEVDSRDSGRAQVESGGRIELGWADRAGGNQDDPHQASVFSFRQRSLELGIRNHSRQNSQRRLWRKEIEEHNTSTVWVNLYWREPEDFILWLFDMPCGCLFPMNPSILMTLTELVLGLCVGPTGWHNECDHCLRGLPNWMSPT